MDDIIPLGLVGTAVLLALLTVMARRMLLFPLPLALPPSRSFLLFSFLTAAFPSLSACPLPETGLLEVSVRDQEEAGDSPSSLPLPE